MVRPLCRKDEISDRYCDAVCWLRKFLFRRVLRVDRRSGKWILVVSSGTKQALSSSLGMRRLCQTVSEMTHYDTWALSTVMYIVALDPKLPPCPTFSRIYCVTGYQIGSTNLQIL